MDRRDILAERPVEKGRGFMPGVSVTPARVLFTAGLTGRNPDGSLVPRRDGAPDPSRLRASRRRPGPRGGEIRRCHQAACLCRRPGGVQHRRTGGACQVLRRRPSSVDRTGRAAPGRPGHARRGGARGRPRRLLSGKAAAREVQRREPPGGLLPGSDRQRGPTALPGRSDRQQPRWLHSRRGRLAAAGGEDLREHRPRPARRRGDAGQRGEGNDVGTQHRLLAPARRRCPSRLLPGRLSGLDPGRDPRAGASRSSWWKSKPSPPWHRGGLCMPFSTIATPEARPVANYKLATRMEGGRLLYVSGQVAWMRAATSSARATWAPRPGKRSGTFARSCRRRGATSAAS